LFHHDHHHDNDDNNNDDDDDDDDGNGTNSRANNYNANNYHSDKKYNDDIVAVDIVVSIDDHKPFSWIFGVVAVVNNCFWVVVIDEFSRYVFDFYSHFF
jgi:hypothetical protein